MFKASKGTHDSVGFRSSNPEQVKRLQATIREQPACVDNHEAAGVSQASLLNISGQKFRITMISSSSLEIAAQRLIEEVSGKASMIRTPGCRS